MSIRTKEDIKLARRVEGGVYYYRFVVPARFRAGAGVERVVYRSSGKMTVGEAREVAWADWLATTGQTTDPMAGRVPLKTPYRTVEDLLVHYVERAPVVLAGRLKGYHGNAQTVRRMLRLVGVPAERARLDVISRATWEAWVAARYAAAGLRWPQALKEPHKLNNCLESEHQQMSAVFGDRVRALVFEGWVWPPEIEGFLAVPALRKVSDRFKLIPRLLEMDASFAAITDPAEGWRRVGYELARYCGLRRSEVLRAAWEHVEGDRLVVRAHKNDRTRLIPLRADRLERWRAWAVADGLGMVGPIFRCPGRSGVELARALSLEVSRWLPGDREKTLHELRKQAGSDVLTVTRSMPDCAEYLGITLAVAEAHYGRVDLVGRLEAL